MTDIHRNAPETRRTALQRAYGRRSWRKLAERQIANRPSCYACGARRNLVAGHVVPPERGGAMLDPANLVTLCRPCNSAMGRWTLDEWQRSESYARRSALRSTSTIRGTGLARPLARPRPRIY